LNVSRYILAHDLGTSGDKASLFDEAGRTVHSALAGYGTSYPHPGWAEQDPDDWWQAVCLATRRLLAEARIDPAEIGAVSFSGQMMACLPVDAKGKPLRSAIIWADQRAIEEAAWMAERCGAEAVYRRTGQRVGPSYSAPKILWFKRHAPEDYARTHAFLQAKDYAVLQLTGQYATDYSDASGTLLFDLATRRWAEDLFAALELDPRLVPPAHPSATIVGGVTRAAAEATGLAAGTPVVIGGGDGCCATAGAGVSEEGDAYAYIGSSAWLSIVSRRPLLDPRQRTTTFAHLDPDYCCPMGSMQSAGGAYGWLEGLLRGNGEESIYAELDDAAAKTPPGADGILFLPHLLGERSPYWNPLARGAFIGLSLKHGRAAMARAVLEGVAMNLRQILEALREQGARIPALRLIGGGASSALWRQIMADVLGLPILQPVLLTEATSLGAAIAGGVGVGMFKSFSVAREIVPATEAERPRAEARQRYEALYPLWQRAYRQVEPLFAELAASCSGEREALP
jgi:xylulokinase